MKKLIFLLLLISKAYAETVGVIGAGYVGLVFSGMLSKWGHDVICFDIDKERVALLNRGVLPIYEPGLSELLADNICFTTSCDALRSASIFFVCVATPSDAQGDCDLSRVIQALDCIASFNQKRSTVCLRSTVCPGAMKILEEHLKFYPSIELVYNPEFMREGSAISDIQSKNPIVLGSRSPSGMETIKKIYAPLLVDPDLELIETTPETAELIKYGWNAFSAIRITYINELSRLCNHFTADIDTLVQGISSSEKLLPTAEITPGCAYGGSCLPKDTLALSRIFERGGAKTSLVHQAIASNTQHLGINCKRLMEFIGKEPQKIAILGGAFKANTDDVRLAPSITIIQSLLAEGHSVRAYDPHALVHMQKAFPMIDCFGSPYQAIEGSDCILVLTDAAEIKALDLCDLYVLAARKKIADFKNIFSPVEMRAQNFEFINMGRLE